ncbi:unnamed protein product [Haemonchus placei]|uniref:G_PROTEIN_RECEP_F1_2 domain-containing protein n=1 Tax=Haemonchus placei TaxID=6290 RepID=A0A0N4X2D2_HAEPC|nr:unnamed protein product [Haemonchus placei]
MVDVKLIVINTSVVILILGTVLNLIFIYIIRNGTRGTISNAYKNIMSCFAVFNIMFAATEFFVKPVKCFTTIPLYLVDFLVKRNQNEIFPWGRALLSAFIGMYGANTALLTLHFVYRYVAVCRYVGSCAFIFGSLRGHLFVQEKVGDLLVIYWSNTIGIFLTLAMMAITFALMLVCGIATYRTLKKSTLSPKTKALQTRLLKALTIQVFFSWRHFTVFTQATMLMSYNFRWYSFTPLIVTMYTVLDPIVVMLFLCDYRKTLKSLRRNGRFFLNTGLGVLGKVAPTVRYVIVATSESSVNLAGSDCPLRSSLT